MSNWMQKVAQLQLGVNIHFDPQTFDREGYPNWKDKIEEINNKRSRMRSEAEKVANNNGHKLSPWTCMDTSMCRRCGQIVRLNNVLCATNAPDHTGSVILNKCNKPLEGETFEEYTVQDYNGKTII